MSTTTSKRADWLVPAGLIVLNLVPAVGGVARMTELATGGPMTPENARFFEAPLPVLLHILSAIVFGLLGALQFSPALRRRSHRAAARILVPSALLVAGTGLWMTLTYPWPAGDGVLVYVERLVFGTAMLACTVLGVEAIRRRDFAEHGAWMTRAYAIGLGAGTQVLTHLPWFLLMDAAPGELARGVMMGSAWVINLAVVEWILGRRPGLPGVTRSAATREEVLAHAA